MYSLHGWRHVVRLALHKHARCKGLRHLASRRWQGRWGKERCCQGLCGYVLLCKSIATGSALSSGWTCSLRILRRGQRQKL